MKIIFVSWILLISINLANASFLHVVGNGCYNGASKNYNTFGCENSNDISCLCTSNEFLQSVMKCIQTENGQDDRNLKMKYGRKAIKKLCNEGLERRAISDFTLRNALKKSEKNENNVLEVRSSWKDELDPKALEIITAASEKRELSDLYGLYFGSAILGYMLIVVLLRSFSNLVYKAMPSILKLCDNKISRKVRKHILLPAAFRKHHSQSYYIKSFSFNVPTRQASLITAGYVILNIIFCFSNYQTFHAPPDAEKIVPENYLHSFKPSVFLLGQISQRTGIVPTLQVPLLFLFGGRNNFMIWITGWSLDTFSVFHKWFGRVIIIELLVHAIVYSVDVKDFYAMEWTYRYWNWGVVGFICGAFIFFQSLHWLRTKSYEIFLVLHIFFSVFFVVGGYYHLIDMRFYECIYASFAVWIFDRLFRIVRIVFSGVKSKADVKIYGDNVMEIKIDYSKRWKYYPGSYAYLHFLKKNAFWQNHPFSLVESPRNEDEGKIVAFAKAKKGLTKQLRSQVAAGDSNTDNIQQFGIWVEGPYGSHHPVHKYDEIVIFAGGVGITGVYGYASTIKKQSERQQKIYLHWVIADSQPLEWFGEYIDYLKDDDRFEVTIHITKRPEGGIVEETTQEKETPGSSECPSEDSSEQRVDIIGDGGYSKKSSESLEKGIITKSFQRPSCYDLTQSHISTCKGSSAYVVCGPGKMNDEIRKSIADNIENANGRVDYFEESYSW